MSLLPDVHVVVLNRNGRRFLEACFQSLEALDYPSQRLELVLVDNASEDESVSYIERAFPEVRIVRNPDNYGFARGNNEGIRRALERGADYVVLLNNDTRVDPDWLRALVEVAEAHPDVAICGGKILSWEGTIIEFSGTVWHKVTSAGGYTNEPDRGQYDEMHPAAYACGASMLLRTEALRRIGLFDEDYFIYHEDVDLSLRAWIAGYRVLYVPQSVIYHWGGGYTAGTPMRDYLGMRNALTTVLKCYAWETWREICRELLRIYLVRSPAYLKRAFLYNLAVLPKTLLKRRHVQALRKRSDHEIFGEVLPCTS